jgi:hypothetical protein
MQIGELFEREVTRAIPPVVYFHEQEPGDLEREVTEYIITGGYPKGDPRATEDGIHEQFVRLLVNMRRELESGAKNPACWISGFYGSGKSSFAKLLGLALDGCKLPSGKTLAEALLAQDVSPDASSFKSAFQAMIQKPVEPMAVVFDVGSRARDDEHVHAVVVRQVQHRLRYSTTSQLVAEYELKLELEGLHEAFMTEVRKVHDRPWTELKDSQLAEDYFSAVLHAMKPDLYPEPMSWVDSRSGSQFAGKRSADEAVQAIADMMRFRAPGKTLFVVVDEVSQYVHDDEDRMLALQSFAMALGERLKGKAWLLATGQQKLEEGAGGATAIVKLKDRFPPPLRVHLGVANIRDVVQRRLLRKKPSVESLLGEMFDEHRADLTLHAYQCESIGRDELIESYPVLPGQFDLISRITTGLRHRSTRAQGDSYAIRGIMQLLGDLFRERELARLEVGRLVTIDDVYDVLGSALDADVQLTIGRALAFAENWDDPLMARVVKAVAMLEIVQEHDKTSPELIARCLYRTLGQGNEQPKIQTALDKLRGQSFIGYSEKTGYKIESSAGQEWQRERDAYSPGAEQRSGRVMTALTRLLEETPGPRLDKLALPWLGLFSDGLASRDVHIKDERKHTVVTVDFQMTRAEADQWVARTGSPTHRDRIVWVVGETDGIRDAATRLERSAKMVHSYEGRQSSLPADKQRLLVEERNRQESAEKALSEEVQSAFLSGQIVFRERTIGPRQHGQSFKDALGRFAQSVVLELYPHPTTFAVTEKDLLFLIENRDLSAPPPVLGQDQLGILSFEAGRYEVSCSGRVPSDVLAFVKDHDGAQGATLLSVFGAPPHGVLPDVLRASVVGLLRARKIRVEIPGVGELTSVQDEGARELLKEGGLRKARLTLNTTETLDPRARNAICQFFADCLGKDVARDNDAIAEAVVAQFAAVRQRVTILAERFRGLPRGIAYPPVLQKLEEALEACRRDRKVEPTVLAVKKHLGALRDGVDLLRKMETDLTEEAITVVRDADRLLHVEWPSFGRMGADPDSMAAVELIEALLASERPWRDAPHLAASTAVVRTAIRARRATLLDAHATKLEQAIELMKRRAGVDKLDPDQRHQVIQHLRDAAMRDEDWSSPPFEALESHLTQRRDAAEAKARAQLDEILEKGGASPVVELEVSLAGREIETEAELDRVLDELRRRVLHQLAAKHRVRLK